MRIFDRGFIWLDILAVLVLCLFLSMPVRAEIASGTFGSCPWSIDDEGVLTIGEDGLTSRFYCDGWGPTVVPWSPYRSKITKAVSRGTVSMGGNPQYFLANCPNLTFADLSHLRPDSDYINVWGVFHGCAKLTSVDLSGWDLSGVSDIQCFFANCSSLTKIDLSQCPIDMSHNNYEHAMAALFKNCKSLTSLNLGAFNNQADRYGTSAPDVFTGTTALREITFGGYFSFKRIFPDFTH